jgi:hypothetical protein
MAEECAMRVCADQRSVQRNHQLARRALRGIAELAAVRVRLTQRLGSWTEPG